MEQKDISSLANIVGSYVLTSLDILGQHIQLPTNVSSLRVSKENIAFAATQLQNKKVKFSVSTADHLECSFEENQVDFDNSITIPKSVAEALPTKVGIYFFAFRNDDMFQPRDPDAEVESIIISATVNGIKMKNLKNPIEIVFEKKSEDAEVVCKYWKIGEQFVL